jgi:hypothetical protein
MGYTRRCKTGSPQFSFDKADRRVTVYYFYILDPAFGLGFIKICSYFPYPLKMWVNGHVRHEAPLNPSGDERAPPLGCRSSPTKLRAA